MRTLARAVLRESIGWFLIYLVAYAALIALAMGVPLVKKGAPLDAVALFLIDQFVFLAVIVIPLAMVTALLGVIGRMREEGELTALMAGGISTWAVGRSLLPLAATLALVVAFVAHWLLPQSVKRIFEGQSQLGQQMIATQVARRVPIVSQKQTVIAAVSSEKQILRHVFAVTETPGADGRVTRRVCYAPEARWMWLEREGQLGFDLREPAFVQCEPPKPGKPREILSGFVENYWSIRESDWKSLGKHETEDLFDVRNDIDTRSDVLSTPRLAWLISHPGDPERLKHSVRYLRELQRALHLRLMMPVGVIAYWAFACGVGLSLGRGTRLFAMCTGVLAVAATVIVPIVVVKNLRGNLGFDPGWILWPPVLGAGLLGAWLMWRQR
jgi:lipopolysaccharide export LptBFGC system permease protein LptF